MAIYRPPVNDEDGEPSTDGADEKSSAQPKSDTVPQAVGDRLNPERTVHSTVHAINKFRLTCGKIVNDNRAQTIIIICIVINAIMMGIATFDFVTDNPAVDKAFESTDSVFLVIFTVELAMQLVYHGYTLFLDGWLLFDFIIVVLSWSFNSLQIIRAFRIFRALRIITRIETMRNLVAALFDIMPRLGAITALLILIFYIFAVLFTQLFGELELSYPYFSRLDHSLLTLFVMMTMEWADVAREVMAEVWWAWAPFVAFIMITGFIVFNLIIAVVCDAVAVIENKSDLEPDILGVFSGENSEIGGGIIDVAEANKVEEDLVESLADRISSVLDGQREMLATLELLARDSIVPTQQGKLSRENEKRDRQPETQNDLTSLSDGDLNKYNAE